MIKKYTLIIHSVMLFTILATITLFFDSRIARLLFSIGASSGFIALGVFSAAVVTVPVGILSGLWLCLFPIILTISYIMVFNNRYVPFCVVITLDALAVLVWSLYSIITRDFYSFQEFVLDLIVSSVLSVTIIRTTYLLKRCKLEADG